ncbi:hypothetical protein INR49_007323, partial [Caranx melampygus]
MCEQQRRKLHPKSSAWAERPAGRSLQQQAAQTEAGDRGEQSAWTESRGLRRSRKSDRKQQVLVSRTCLRSESLSSPSSPSSWPRPAQVKRCERCVLMPGCVHGSCEQPWQCSCDLGWGGRFCDKDLSVCSERQPCQNGATCVMEDSGEYTCLSPCKNGGLCEDADGFAEELTCRCLAGFTGQRCETDVDDCLMAPCGNGATCLDGINRFSCLCPAGFTGRFCTVNLDDCASQPCFNAGRCLDRAAGFQCICQPGYTGATCETPLRNQDTHELGQTGRGGVRHHMTTGGNQRTGSNSSRYDERLFKVTVSERGTSGLTEVQFIILLVLAGLTSHLVISGPTSSHLVPPGPTWSTWPYLSSRANQQSRSYIHQNHRRRRPMRLQTGATVHVQVRLKLGQLQEERLGCKVVENPP